MDKELEEIDDMWCELVDQYVDLSRISQVSNESSERDIKHTHAILLHKTCQEKEKELKRNMALCFLYGVAYLTKNTKN